MVDTDQLERDLELAEATLRSIRAEKPNRGDPGWVTNRRANFYAVEAEIARLKNLLDDRGWTERNFEPR